MLDYWRARRAACGVLMARQVIVFVDALAK